MSLGLEEHLSRAFQDKLRLQMVPAWDSASLLPSRRLLLKRREVVEVEQALQAQREVQPPAHHVPPMHGCFPPQRGTETTDFLWGSQWVLPLP